MATCCQKCWARVEKWFDILVKEPLSDIDERPTAVALVGLIVSRTFALGARSALFLPAHVSMWAMNKRIYSDCLIKPMQKVQRAIGSFFQRDVKEFISPFESAKVKACVIAEVIFRGCIQTFFALMTGPWVGILLTTVIATGLQTKKNVFFHVWANGMAGYVFGKYGLIASTAFNLSSLALLKSFPCLYEKYFHKE